MTCAKALSMINGFLHDSLSPHDTLEFIDHVKNCRNCYDELEIQYMVMRFTGTISDNGEEDYGFAKRLKEKIEYTEKRLVRRYRCLRLFLLIALILIILLAVYIAFIR